MDRPIILETIWWLHLFVHQRKNSSELVLFFSELTFSSFLNYGISVVMTTKNPLKIPFPKKKLVVWTFSFATIFDLTMVTKTLFRIPIWMAKSFLWECSFSCIMCGYSFVFSPFTRNSKTSDCIPGESLTNSNYLWRGFNTILNAQFWIFFHSILRK